MITLRRISQTDKGTFGVLLKDGLPLCVTCEDPWKNNAVGESCIPSGIYDCVPHSGDKYKDVWRLLNVQGRDAILIHHGNTPKDTRGCILVGKGFGAVNGVPGISESLITIGMLRTILPKRFSMEIINP